MLQILSISIITVYILSAMGLMLYGLNCYVMTWLFLKKIKRAEKDREKTRETFDLDSHHGSIPRVTTQIPVYNEINVVERIIRSACRMKYPKHRHEIQILDDSSDKTSELIDEIVRELKAEGHDIKTIRRQDRTGFKAGALAHGLKSAKGDLVAVFDADFVPPEDYLYHTVPFFLANPKLGLVQARWGHLNRRRSLLTRVQSIGIDGHFMIEQSARCWNNLFMNFNGTAGIWKKQAIHEAGGWQWDTLTEDMDLSYRVQFAGWKTAYVPNLIVPAEIPEDVSAFKSQQFRWAKGSIQTAMKLLPDLIHSRVSLFKKIEAVFHLTHYMVHPLMLILAILALPVIVIMNYIPGPYPFAFIALLLLFSMIAPSTLYLTAQRFAYPDWKKRIVFLPFLVMAGIGIAVSNSKAVMEALFGRESDFIRTPKRGDRLLKNYQIRLSGTAVLEIILGIYCAFSFSVYLTAGKFLVGPFLAIYAAGFLFTGLLTIAHSIGFYR